ncbi:MAG: dihydroorotase [Thermodesulfobacteriota bacterium]|nr:dihydroorotase [Thermodesulfobacteriota bacterium]
MNILLKGGRIIDPSQNIDEKTDILVEEGKIAQIGQDIYKSTETDSAPKILNLEGKIVVPGLIDMHTHLREPGFEYKETIQTGCEAAVAGGFTSIACMPNTNPINDNRSVTELIRRQATQCNLANVYPIAAISKGSEGITLTEFGDLKDAGAVGFSDDGRPVMNSALMRRALEYASSLNIPIISHCEETNLSADGLMNEGIVSTELGLQGIPNIAEDIMVARDIAIADYTNTSVHIAHVSTAGSVRLIRKAKERGLEVTAETAPHYFSLTDEALMEYDTYAKVYPPLRSADDVTAIKEGLFDGTIDAIASDHAPHSLIEKDVEFEYAFSGMIGLETSLSLSLKLVADGNLTLDQLILKMSTNPAGILGIPKGTLKIGSDADITVIDTERKWTVDINKFRSKSKNSPFNGWNLKGMAVLTIAGGEIKYSV